MGDANTGGGGSVIWNVEAGHAAKVKSAKRGSKGHCQSGHDMDTSGDWFTVSVKVPKGYKSAQGYLKALRLRPDPTGRKRVFFNLPIEKDEQQIRISWGNSPHQLDEALRALKACQMAETADPAPRARSRRAGK